MRRALITFVLVCAGIGVAWLLNRRANAPPEAEPPSFATEQTGPERRRDAVDPGGATLGADAGVDQPPEPFHFDLADLDFEALRRETPDSLYWLMAAPTKDPALLEARARNREERNRQYGKVVSNTATVEEIHDYYAYRRKLSEDYIEVLQLILDEHGDELSERDTGLFELTISLHTARLAELPSKLDDALRRKAEYDEVKKEWQEQQRRDAEEPSD
jgi:hypothetical protein